MGMGGMGMGGMGGMGGYGGVCYARRINPNFSMTYDDMMLRNQIDQIFYRYDINRTGTLNFNELYMYLNELFGNMGYMGFQISPQEAINLFRQADTDFNGQINKYELFNMFKYLTVDNYQPMPYTYMGRQVGYNLGSGYGYSITPVTTSYVDTYGGVGMGGIGMGGIGMGGVGMGGFNTGTYVVPGSVTTTTYTTTGSFGGMGAWGGW